jgi:hypothetical protein
MHKLIANVGHALCPVFQSVKPWLLAAYTMAFGPVLLLFAYWIASRL